MTGGVGTTPAVMGMVVAGAGTTGFGPLSRPRDRRPRWSTAWPTAGSSRGSTRPPVGREMVLEFVAQHRLGLPKREWARS